jgi:hypothetical protein
LEFSQLQVTPKADRYLPLGRISMVAWLQKLYNHFPVRLRLLIQSSGLNFYFYALYSFLISKTQNSYSQTGEDELILKYLPEAIGSFVDVGAGQPVRGSNTYYFYKKGWSGTLIDPVEFNLRLTKLFRRRDKFIQSIVSAKNTPLKFYEFYPAEYSTIEKSVAENLVKRGIKLKHEIDLNPISLSSLNLSYKPLDASLLSIDVEGHDLEVLQSNNWSSFKPRVICVEENISDMKHSNSKIANYLITYGYRFVESTELSSIYVHLDYLEPINIPA